MIEIKVPSVGESIQEATVAQILKESGSFVKEGEEILELETDKVNQMIYAPATGVLNWKIQPEEVVQIGQVIGSIEPKEATKQDLSKEEVKPSSKEEKKELSSSLPSPEKAPSKGGNRKRMSQLRRLVAQRLLEAKQSTAMLTTFNEVDMSLVTSLREKHKQAFLEKHQVKLGFASFFVKAVIHSLQKYPELNAFIEGEEIVYPDHYDIGIAVSTDKGLMVPVLLQAETMKLGEIEIKLKDFAEKARQGTISAKDLQGGTFTITNGGAFGSLFSTPILNPPQSGILGMHTIQPRPVAIEGKVEIRPMMYMALSYDHRIIDGKEAIGFLKEVKQVLEDTSFFSSEF